MLQFLYPFKGGGLKRTFIVVSSVEANERKRPLGRAETKRRRSRQKRRKKMYKKNYIQQKAI